MPNNLSGDQQHRVVIAGALVFKPAIVLADEATTNVDQEKEDQLQQAIEALTKDKKIFMIAHNLKTAQNADKIVVMDAGRIVQEGRHEELIRQE